eukprot:scaffold2028_cov353-Pavlova_lutheri.AAC.16
MDWDNLALLFRWATPRGYHCCKEHELLVHTFNFQLTCHRYWAKPVFPAIHNHVQASQTSARAMLNIQ